ncbi:nitrite reductase small subunit NirD [Methylobacter sp. S3L5C]|uniref:nitrite reductase small subunit NirD n=1 Tax=Methylobacter sp. S3L5C TaxID=2839024 RepID=UPI001FAE5C95|nr:nitrite reductase small subunit NirD [Methylobacter sp. S3L5C]UOA10251.1 nitrite reductase small subunit NirD [Methylobacter sp. S3L5C]
MVGWQDVCSIDDLQPDSGVCALVDGQQVALFYMPKESAVYAINNYDPFGKANVLSRGLIGDINGQPVVASPLYKQHFNLQTGICLEDETVTIPAYAVRMENGSVQISMTESPDEL